MSKSYTLTNGKLKIEVRANGAELDALMLNGTDYLWQGDPAYWEDKAPNLFPYIGRLVDKTYTYRGRPYRLDIHGFVKDRQLTCAQQNGALIFELASDAETRAAYPFDFVYRVRYALKEQTLIVTYEVENKSDETMFFGIGGHPGFRVPLGEGLMFSDYKLVFDAPCSPRRVLFSDDCFVAGDEAYPLRDGRTILLRHDLFDDDAIILSGTSGMVTLKSDKGSRAVTVSYPGFDYIGFWHRPQTDAPYICIEPWSSLPARSGMIEELTEQPGLVKLEEGGTYRNEWTITLQ